LPNDVKEWRWSLKTQRLADGTIYNRISALAQFYEYLRTEVGMMKLIPINPARVSLPKASKPFQSESVKALSREELSKLLEVVGNYTQGKQPIHLRDHALLQFYVSTGRRRAVDAAFILNREIYFYEILKFLWFVNLSQGEINNKFSSRQLAKNSKISQIVVNLLPPKLFNLPERKQKLRSLRPIAVSVMTLPDCE
jgi:site-specific recombinase XerC